MGADETRLQAQDQSCGLRCRSCGPDALHSIHDCGPGKLPGGRTVNPQEIMAYLAAPHIAVVATVSRNGTPHLTPNWYRYNGKVLTVITRTDRLKYLHLQRNNRISVCLYDPPPRRIMSSSPGPRPAMTKISGTRAAALSSATGHRTRWTTIWRAGKRSPGCSSR
jgi:hypothetical protein